jgi:ComF family protein
MLYGSPQDLCVSCDKSIAGYALAEQDLSTSVYSEVKRVYTAFRYDGGIRDALLRLKFNGMKDNARRMALLMKRVKWREDFYSDIKNADYLVPVPLHKNRLKERGFNQSELLAAALSKEYGVPVLNILARVRKTEYMYGLSRTGRLENVRGAFTIVPFEGKQKASRAGKASPRLNVEGKNIIIIDDIYTTGATIEECARTLKKAGAESVCCLAFSAANANYGDGHSDF